MLTPEKIKVFETSIKRSVKERIERGFIKTYKPVINDTPNCKTFTKEEYSVWCENLPRFLGYYKVKSI